MIKKNKIIHLPKLHNVMGPARSAYIKTMLQHPRPKHPTDFVETLIDEKKQLMKNKKHDE